MKKLFLFLMLFSIFFVSDSYSKVMVLNNSSILVNELSTNYQTSTAIISGKVAFGGIVIKTDGTNDITLNIYDNTTNSGKRLIPPNSVISGSAKVWALGYDPPIKCSNGIYVEVSVAGGGTCSFQVVYDQG
jgi:hypothetical protein